MDQDLNKTSDLKSKKPLLSKKILIGVVLVFLLVGIFVAARTILLPSSDRVLAEAFFKMKNLESYSYDFKGVVNLNTDQGSGGFSYNFNGKENVISQKTRSTFRFDIFWEEIIMMFNGEVAVETKEKQAIYFKFDTLPTLPFIDINPLKNQWIRSDISEKLGDYQKRTKLINDLYALMIEKNVIKTRKEMPVIEMNNIPVYRIRAYLDKENFRKAFPEMKNLINNFQSEDASIFSDEDYRNIEEFINRLEEIELDFYIGRRDGYIHRITFVREFQAKEILNMNEDELKSYFEMYPEAKNIRLFFNLDFNFSNFNKAPTVEMPTDYINIEELRNLLVPAELEL